MRKHLVIGDHICAMIWRSATLLHDSRERAMFIPTGMLEMRYQDTYWYAQVIFRTLTDSFDHLRTLDNFFGEEHYRRFVQPFPKWSILHDYVLFSLLQIEFEEMPDNLSRNYRVWQEKSFGPRVFATPLESQLAGQDIPHISFEEWATTNGVASTDTSADHFLDYYEHLGGFGIADDKRYADGPRGLLYERLTDELFFLLFPNRQLLLALNDWAAFCLHELEIQDVEQEDQGRFASSGVLKRAHVPEWVKSAVFFRDRGHCVLCGTNLTNLATRLGKRNFDHIVPLARGGANDVTNVQLLCEDCNQRKADHSPMTKNLVEKWY